MSTEIEFSQPRPVLWRASVLIAAFTLAVNDHFLKAWFPGPVTGKLSDFAGLFILGSLLAWVFRGFRLGPLLAIASLFAAWKSPVAAPVIEAWNRIGLFEVARTVDYTDLVALIALPAGAYAVAVARTPASRPFRNLSLAAFSLFLFTATSKVYTVDLADFGGSRTVQFSGSIEALSDHLNGCGYEFTPSGPEGGRDSTISLVTEELPYGATAIVRLHPHPSGVLLVVHKVTARGAKPDAESVGVVVSEINSCVHGAA